MKIVVQRVSQAKVVVNDKVAGKIDKGLLLLLGIAKSDTEKEAEKMARKIAGLRIFADLDDKMNRSVLDINGSALVIPQFTLFGEVKGQNRPFFGEAAAPERARKLFYDFIEQLKTLKIKNVETGEFGAYMQVELVNDGPVTILLDSSEI